MLMPSPRPHLQPIDEIQRRVRDPSSGCGIPPPSPPIPPDIRPPLAPSPPVPGEALATAVHAGDPDAGSAFISAWRQLVSALEGAADSVRTVAAQLPELGQPGPHRRRARPFVPLR